MGTDNRQKLLLLGISDLIKLGIQAELNLKLNACQILESKSTSAVYILFTYIINYCELLLINVFCLFLAARRNRQ